MIQHDMMLWDHGMPRTDGTWNPEQRPEADVNLEFQSTAKFAEQAMKLAFFFRDANERYATDYPAAVGPHMTNTDSTPFMDLVPAISVREKAIRGSVTLQPVAVLLSLATAGQVVEDEEQILVLGSLVHRLETQLAVLQREVT